MKERGRDVLVFSGRAGVSGPSVSVAVTSSSVAKLVSDVNSHNPSSTPAILVHLFPSFS